MFEDKVRHNGDIVEKYRMFAALSFATLLIVVGVPLWWKTTEVYRVQLPYSSMQDLYRTQPKIFMHIFIASSDQSRGEFITEELNKQFDKCVFFNIKFKPIVIDFKILDESTTPAILEAAILKTNPINIGDFIFIEWKKLSDKVLVTSDRSAYFALDTSAIKLGQVISKWILHEESLNNALNSMRNTNISLTTAIQPTPLSKDRYFQQNNRPIDANVRRRVPPSPAYDIMITVVNPNPEKLQVTWNLEAVMDQFLSPFLDDLKILANFTLKSQWLYFVELDYQPKQVQDQSLLGRHYALPEDILPHLITPLEKKLASHVSRNPCLNLVLYTPPCNTAPLHIYNKQGLRVKSGGSDAFLSPRWGGVLISNPPTDGCKKVLESDEILSYTPNTPTVMGTFLHQVRMLLGIPVNENIDGVELVQIDTLTARAWEKDSLLRVRTMEQIISASMTLQSIAQLLGEINNIVINDEVGKSITDALNNCNFAIECLKNKKLEDAVVYSKAAFVSAESAFTDPSLLALLYFPDDQKYAIYIPLFLPIMIPVIFSLKSLRCWLFPQKSTTTKQKDE